MPHFGYLLLDRMKIEKKGKRMKKVAMPAVKLIKKEISEDVTFRVSNA